MSTGKFLRAETGNNCPQTTNMRSLSTPFIRYFEVTALSSTHIRRATWERAALALWRPALYASHLYRNRVWNVYYKSKALWNMFVIPGIRKSQVHPMLFHSSHNVSLIMCTRATGEPINAWIVTYLGVVIDHNINWKMHIESQCKKLGSVCFVIFKCTQFLMCQH